MNPTSTEPQTITIEDHVNTALGNHAQPFVADCLHAVNLGNWGSISPTEAAINHYGIAHAGKVFAAFEVPDHIDPEQVLLIDVDNTDTSNTRVHVRLLDYLEVTA